jgi:hypothetical protein
MFWGAPLVARELETGTFRLAWTQGVTRTRWLAAKLAIAGAAAIAAGELFTLMVNWWSSPIHKANVSYTAFTSSSFHSGVAPAGYAAFAFALGVTAGLLIRRTLPAMAVTLAIFTAVIIAFPIWVRPHLIPPARATSALSLASAAVTGSTSDGHLILTTKTWTVLPGAWVISSQLTTPDGRAASSEPAGPCGTASTQACNAYIESLHFQHTVIYEPASRYWACQWTETAIYLAFSFLLTGLCFLRIRPGRSAEPGVHRPRATRPAPHLKDPRDLRPSRRTSQPPKAATQPTTTLGSGAAGLEDRPADLSPPLGGVGRVVLADEVVLADRPGDREGVAGHVRGQDAVGAVDVRRGPAVLDDC